MRDLSETLAILSSMISPVVLIMASGSLILTTSQRLSRVIERTRKLTDQVKELVKNNSEQQQVYEEAQILFTQLDKATRRAKLLQRAMTALYLTLGVFVATSITIGLVNISNIRQTWIPIALSILGAALLFYASVILIMESRIAVTAVDQEMNQSISFFRRHFPDLKKESPKSWWQRYLSQRNRRSQQ
jgi:hypothetical protein